MANSRQMKIEIPRLCNLHLHVKSRVIGSNAGYGIRTRELLRDGILSPAPFARLGNPDYLGRSQAVTLILILITRCVFLLT